MGSNTTRAIFYAAEWFWRCLITSTANFDKSHFRQSILTVVALGRISTTARGTSSASKQPATTAKTCRSTQFGNLKFAATTTSCRLTRLSGASNRNRPDATNTGSTSLVQSSRSLRVTGVVADHQGGRL